MVLTAKQKREMHTAICQYLEGQGKASAPYAEALAALKAATGVTDDDIKQSRPGLLERKWNSVVRLQKKLMDAEAKVAQLEADLKRLEREGPPNGSGETGAIASSGLPSGPAQSTLSGHRSTVTAVEFHPVYNLAASSSEDASVKIWDVESSTFERALKGHTNVVNDIAFSPTGDRLVSCSADLSVKLWDFGDTYMCLKTCMGHDHNVSGVVFFPSSQHFASSSRDATIRVWEVATGFCVRTLSGHGDWVRRVVTNSSGSMLASCSNDQTVRVWSAGLDGGSGGGASAASGMVCTLRGHEHVVECVAFANPSARKVLLGKMAGEAATQAASGGGVAQKDLALDSGISKTEFVVSGSRDRKVCVWAVPSGQCIMTFTAHENWVRGLAFHPAGKYLFSAAEDRTVRVFDLKERRCVRTITSAHDHFLTCIAVQSRGGLVLTGSVDKAVKVWKCR